MLDNLILASILAKAIGFRAQTQPQELSSQFLSFYLRSDICNNSVCNISGYWKDPQPNRHKVFSSGGLNFSLHLEELCRNVCQKLGQFQFLFRGPRHIGERRRLRLGACKRIISIPISKGAFYLYLSTFSPNEMKMESEPISKSQ